MLKRLFSGTAALLRFILWRDRLRLPLWLLGVAGLTILCVPLFANMFDTPEELKVMGEIMQNPAMIAMVGPVYGLDNYHAGAMFANMMLVIMGLFAGAMNVFFVTRHTRQDEEQGRLELIRSLPVGRLSGLAAVLFAAFKINLLMALLIGFGMAAFQVESMYLAPSLLFGAAMGAAGLVFAGAATVFCQLSSSNRTASGFALAFLMGAYMLRAMGDVSAEALSLLSPLGLISRTQVYVENYVWPIFVLLGVFAALGGLALALNKLRDLGQGMIAAKPGRAKGGFLLSSPLGLAIRLCKTSLYSWAGVLVLFGIMYGSVLNEMENFIAGSEMLQAMFAAGAMDGVSYTEQFVGLLMVIMAVVASIPVVGLMLRLRGEEKQGFTEQILGSSVCRPALFGSYFGIAAFASILFQLLSALSFWGVASVVMEPIPALSTYLQAAMNYLPAIWALLGLAALLMGYFPGRTGLVYAYLGASFFLVYMGSLAQLPEWTLLLSPFGHIPRLPLEEQNFNPLIVLTGIAAVLTIFGFVGFRRRDVKPG